MPAQIPRAPVPFDSDDFTALLELAFSRPWLRKKSKALYDLWRLCDTQPKKDLVVELAGRFRVLERSEIEDLCVSIKTQICDVWELPGKLTTILAASDDSEADGSQLALQLLKSHFAGTESWNDNSFRNTMIGYDSYLRPAHAYVLLDDFIGTGSKIVRKYRAFNKALADRGISNCRVFVVGLAAMSACRQLLDAECISYFSPIWLEKGIDGFNSKQDSLTKRSVMRSMETTLMSRVNGQFVPSLGYKGSQSLFSIDGTTCPNNVFPIFWWPRLLDKSDRSTIMKRLR